MISTYLRTYLPTYLPNQRSCPWLRRTSFQDPSVCPPRACRLRSVAIARRQATYLPTSLGRAEEGLEIGPRGGGGCVFYFVFRVCGIHTIYLLGKKYRSSDLSEYAGFGWWWVG